MDGPSGPRRGRAAGDAVPGSAARSSLVCAPPEIGTVMVQGRIGGTGAPFNLGEMTVTRCVAAAGIRRGRPCPCAGPRQGPCARGGAGRCADADGAARRQCGRRCWTPLRAEEAGRRSARAAKAAATKVEFFTLVRGEDTDELPTRWTGGFADARMQSARAFRAALDAMARPGRIQPVERGRAARAAVGRGGVLLLTLCDGTTPVHLAGAHDCAGRARLDHLSHRRAACGRPKRRSSRLGHWDGAWPLSSRFAIGHAGLSRPLGHADRRDAGAGAPKAPRLTGPGIARPCASDPARDRRPSAPTARCSRWASTAFLTCGNRLAGLPRSTRVEDRLMYVAVKGGERAIDNAHAWLAEERRGDTGGGRTVRRADPRAAGAGGEPGDGRRLAVSTPILPRWRSSRRAAI